MSIHVLLIVYSERALGTSKILDASRRSRTLSCGTEECRLRRIKAAPRVTPFGPSSTLRSVRPELTAEDLSAGIVADDTLIMDQGVKDLLTNEFPK
jgi:hypothetical protein